MSLPVPRYLSDAGVQVVSIRYTWDDWNIKAVEEPLDEALVERLVHLSQRAILAFAIGSAEWLVYRLLDLLDDDRAAWEFLEAAWAMCIHVRYSGYGQGSGWAEYVTADPDDEQTVPERWNGPIKGPVNRALTVLESAIQELAWHGREDPAAYSRYVARGAARVHKLALHVLADPGPYQDWVQRVLARLEQIYPVKAGDELGDIVPREALDPDGAFDPKLTEALVKAFLARTSRSNPFLSDSAAMLENIEDDEDFEGVPYVFDIEADRARRAAGHGLGPEGHRH
jgi:hypothetical protein